MKKQGGRGICTGLHLMCIAQAHSKDSYFIMPLAWPSSQSHCFSMAKTTTEATLTTNEQMIQYLLPDQLLITKSCK